MTIDGQSLLRYLQAVDNSGLQDSWFRGVGPSPIKTELGWLVIYQAMDHRIGQV